MTGKDRSFEISSRKTRLVFTTSPLRCVVDKRPSALRLRDGEPTFRYKSSQQHRVRKQPK